jgi:hypothetical protein
MKIKVLIKCFLLAMLMWESGCASAPRPDPMTGFRFSSLDNLHSNTVITEDYKGYIQRLSPEERRSLGPILYYEDAAGQHAIMIMIGINNTSWRHVLIYDKDDKRIKAIKYVSGHYSC